MNNRMRRAILFSKLGKQCVRCGSTDEKNLSFDHIRPRSYSLAHLSETQRLNQYLRDCAQSLLQVLCVPCNSRRNRVQVNKGFRNYKSRCNCEKCLRNNILKNEMKKTQRERPAVVGRSGNRGTIGWMPVFEQKKLGRER